MTRFHKNIFTRVAIFSSIETNPVDNVLSQGKNILNHVAYKVDNIEEAIKRLQNLNNILITGPIKAKAFDNKRIAFLFTKLRFIIELIEK